MGRKPDCLQSLVEVVQWRAAHDSHRPAYTFLVDGETDEITLTYAELEEQARSLALVLQDAVQPGSRVLVLCPPGLHYVVAVYGCLYAGMVAVPAYPPRNPRHLPRLAALVEDAQAQFALATTDVLMQIERRLQEVPVLAGVRWGVVDSVTADPSVWRQPSLTPDHLALLQYTSGSTSAPKGVMVTHGNLLANLHHIQQCFGLGPESTGVSWLPPYHDMGLIGAVFGSLYIGCPMVLMSPTHFVQRPLRWLEAITRYRATVSGGPNFAYDLCIRASSPEQRQSLDLSSWQVAFCGAEPVRASTLERFITTFSESGFRSSSFYPCYGLAESTLLVSTRPGPVFTRVRGDALHQGRVETSTSEDSDTRHLVSCGPVIPEHEVAVVNPESRTRCEPGRVGEIWVAGPCVAQGYWHRPDETEQTFRARLADTGEGPYLRTGDLGCLIDGELYIVGRLRESIIVRGRNYYPEDIELAVQACHPALSPNAGAAVSVEVDGEPCVVVINELQRTHRHSDTEGICNRVRQVVAQDFGLHVYAVVLLKPGALPRTSSGKIRRRACGEQFMAGTLDAIAVHILRDAAQSRAIEAPEARPLTRDLLWAASSEQRRELLERYLLALVAQTVGLSPGDVDPHQPLVFLGVDSVQTVSLKNRLETELGISLELDQILDRVSVGDLVTTILRQWESATTGSLGASAAPDRIPTLPRQAYRVQEAPIAPKTSRELTSGDG